jgi:hypothetical protein
MDSCDRGWADINGQFSDGCETPLDTYPASCNSAHRVGEVIDDHGDVIDVEGTIAPAGDVDWIRFGAVDNAYNVSGCDRFKLNISFVDDLDGAVVMEVRRGTCAVSRRQCGSTAVDEYDFYVDFLGIGPWGSENRGECSCSTNGSRPRSPNLNDCSNNGAEYFVRIHRPDGQASPDSYRLRISNGAY